ncbi:MAG: hypothetical protein NUW37_02505 [Planctomycetes bacterium]|nr:hypothetical protein [Planctomycetota bacterium]
MKKLIGIAAIFTLIGVGAVYGASVFGSNVESESGYICPLTGEELPCPKCCPSNGE